jgi:predicted secreted protein
MASNAFAGKGTTFRRWAGSAWTAIAEVNSISGPSMSRDTIDVTSLDSTGGYREFIAGFRDPGTVQLTMNFTAGTYETMKTDFESDTEQNYEILFPSEGGNYSLEFIGLVTELPIEIPTDDKVTSTVTVKISGQVTTNSGAASAAP